MDIEKVKKLALSLEKVGVAFEEGLSDQQVGDIERLGTFQFPPDLKAFLQYAVPISCTFVRSWDGGTTVDDSFPNWHKDPEGILQFHQARTRGAFRDDVELNNFWLDEWGPRPGNLDDAFEIVDQALVNAPRLIPLFAHRYLPAFPVSAGNPVLSMAHPMDTIYYGYNLEVYFQNEFFLRSSVDHDWGQLSDYRDIPFWSQIVG